MIVVRRSKQAIAQIWKKVSTRRYLSGMIWPIFTIQIFAQAKTRNSDRCTGFHRPFPSRRTQYPCLPQLKSHHVWAEGLELDKVLVTDFRKCCHGFWELWGDVSKPAIQLLIRGHDENTNSSVAFDGHSHISAEATIAATAINIPDEPTTSPMPRLGTATPRPLPFFHNNPPKGHRVTGGFFPVRSHQLAWVLAYIARVLDPFTS